MAEVDMTRSKEDDLERWHVGMENAIEWLWRGSEGGCGEFGCVRGLCAIHGKLHKNSCASLCQLSIPRNLQTPLFNGTSCHDNSMPI